MQPQLAEHGALVLIKALIKKTPHVIDDGAQLDLFPNMPRLITFKKKKVNLLKATAAELEWYGDWWNRRLEGLATRTKEDLAISSEIERLKRALKKYDPAGTVESALQTRNQRLDKARRAREKEENKKTLGCLTCYHDSRGCGPRSTAVAKGRSVKMDGLAAQ